ncbi:serine phosphatase RsbU, regulator of sigma subunit [Bernardetia litoralis DSM 6794]|uniref:Serine phosphatase RsbU, regulator of sigma subunit n=1 Tax=Bernardetia litoralis (strain ATCC 23117 / DSM 6794 / NBRC 15988 / NCIMB 1366 / Fx l1 / Sio-4) TaxID=880071 RepID=I4AII8_BERLS|nr:SpoIIE family protein phosphatase [Bernardetia litoralis]AFM03773.1 serine phosphatase RsbU, regulator of sigma subunit [Bernardetia litoralis DSM 6794]
MNIDKYLVPNRLLEKNNNTEEYRKAKLIGWSLIIIILFMLIGIPINWILSNKMGTYINTFMTIPSVCVYFYFKRKGNFVVTGNLIATIVLFQFSFLNTLSLQSICLVFWWSIAPISAFLYANKKSGLIWSAIILAVVFIYFSVPFFGYNYPNFSSTQLSEIEALLFDFNAILFYFIYLLSIIYIYETEKDALVNRLVKTNHEMLTQNEEIRQQQEEIVAINDHLAVKNVELDTVLNNLEYKNLKITSSIRYAKTIQHAILPFSKKINSFFEEHFILYRAKDIVSGDFYWLEQKPNSNTIFLAVGDCTGHGVPGAFMSLISFSILNDIVLKQNISSPDMILEQAHELIQNALKQNSSNNADGMDIALCAITRLEDKIKISFSGAKRPLYFTTPLGKIESLRGTRRSIGGTNRKTLKPFNVETLFLEKGSILYLTTDGFADQNNKNNEKFSSLHLMSILSEINKLPLSKQKKQLEITLDKYQEGTEQRDDITVLSVKL